MEDVVGLCWMISGNEEHKVGYDAGQKAIRQLLVDVDA